MRILSLGIGNAQVRFDNVSFHFENYLKNIDQKPEVITFGYNEGVDIRIAPEDDFQKVIDHLPTGWLPDYCVLQGIDYNLLPKGIEAAPFPVVALPYPGDWDMDLLYTRAIAEATDLLIGAGYFDRENFPVIGADNVEIFYQGSVMGKYCAGQPKKIKDRKYDLFFPATWFSDITHPERSQWAIRLLKLAEKYNIRVEARLKNYSDYLSLLGDSKLAFSHVRCGVFSNRVLEAALQGAVPVATGRDVTLYFENNRECIAVNEDDFIYQIERYLKNPELLQEMSDRAYAKVTGEFRSEYRASNLFRLIENNLAGRKLSRKLSVLSDYEKHFRRAEVFFYAFFRTINGGYFFTEKNTERVLRESIRELKEAGSREPSARAKTSLAVAEAALLFQRTGTEAAAGPEGIISSLTEITHTHPEYVSAFFNLGLVYLRSGRHAEALNIFLSAVRRIEEGMGEIDPWCLQNRDYELFNMIVQRPLNECLLLLCGNRADECSGLINRLYQSMMLYLAGQIHENQGDLYRSLDFYMKACGIYADNRLALKKAAQLSALLGFEENAVALFRKAALLLPLDIDFRMLHIRVLYFYKRDAEVMDEVKALLKISKTITPMRYLIFEPQEKKNLLTITPMRARITDLNVLTQGFERLNSGATHSYDYCVEALSKEWTDVIYHCLKRNPQDINLLFRITELYRQTGKIEKAVVFLEDYLRDLNRSDEDHKKNVLPLIDDIRTSLYDAISARRELFSEKLKGLNVFIERKLEEIK